MSSSSRPLRFGRGILDLWLLDPNVVYLNHGTVGVAPRAVLAAQTAIRNEIETNPAAFLLRELTTMLGDRGGDRLRQACDRVASFVGSHGDDLAFVANATDGANAVLGSVGLQSDDEVLITDMTYGGVRQAVRFACRRAAARVVPVTLPCPIAGPEEVLAVFEDAIKPQTRLAVLDHIVSEIGTVLPLGELAKLCRDRGVRVLVDGAHAPGQLALDVPSIGADWYVANLHKWAFAPRSCGILWAAPEARENLHPTTVSWRLDEGFPREFDWTGTRDPSAWLAAPAGIEFLDRLGFDALRAYNHDLVWMAAQELTQRWGTHPVCAETMIASMVAVPLPSRFEADSRTAARLRDTLFYEHRIEVPVFCWRDQLWVRLSAQVYNELDDFERLAVAVDSMS